MPHFSGNNGAIPCSCCSGNVFKPSLECEGFNYVRCVSCGLVQRNPQPAKEEIIERYAQTYGRDYLSYELENEKSFLKLQELALGDMNFAKLEKKLFARCGKEPPSILDIGCATGALLETLRGRGWRVTGVEISPCAEYAQKERALDIKTLPLEETGFSANTFDVIHASHLIEHLNDPRSLLLEAFRILKKDGYLFITTPNIDGFQVSLFGSRWRSAIFDHLYLFSKRTLKDLLKRTGYSVKKISTWGGLAAGFAPLWIKKPVDFLVKPLGIGDVMIICARK